MVSVFGMLYLSSGGSCKWRLGLDNCQMGNERN